MNQLDLIDAQSGDACHLYEPARNFFGQPIEVPGFTSFDELLDDGECCGTDVWRFLQLAGFEERRKVIGAERKNGSCCSLKCS